MKIYTLLFAFVIVLGFQSLAQIAPDKYYVQFTDKDNSPYSISHPEEFLTQRALDRREAQNIDVVENDIPVNPQYLQGVADVGVQLLFATRWMNGVTIYTTDESLLQDILDLPYVQDTRALSYIKSPGKKAFYENEFYGEELKPSNIEKSALRSDLDYGEADFQIDQINGIPLHDAGFQGEGMVIAVLDAGFTGAEVHPVFDSLWANNQILGTKDFVYVGGNVFTESGHGKAVLSCMGANQPGVMIGTAPQAEYWLLRSEETKDDSENVIEEYNWVSAAEFADSVGADVINSSLSYVDFDIPKWDHSYEDLDGNTAVATIGADIAAAKGILVCNSAGNSGNGSFPWNGAPADGDSVLSVGAVGTNNLRVGFSSIGPTVDGRIRPVVMALGYGTVVAEGTSGITWASGTSFSSPVIAGMSACLWQANPNMKVMEIYEGLKESGSYFDNPDNFMGWGIPDYQKANSILTTIEYQFDQTGNMATVWPNPFTDDVNIKLHIATQGQVRFELLSASGSVITSLTADFSSNNGQVDFDKLSKLPKGVYFLKITAEEWVEVKRIVKQ